MGGKEKQPMKMGYIYSSPERPMHSSGDNTDSSPQPSGESSGNSERRTATYTCHPLVLLPVTCLFADSARQRSETAARILLMYSHLPIIMLERCGTGACSSSTSTRIGEAGEREEEKGR